jgi:hypothetical protein
MTFTDCIENKPLLQIDGHLNKSAEDAVENKRHRDEYDDIDQIPPPTRSANFSGGVDLILGHPAMS